MLLKWVNLVLLVVGLICFFAGSYLHGPAELKIRDFLHPEFRNSIHQKSYVDMFAYERYIPSDLRRRYFISTMLLGIWLLCMFVLMFEINDPVAKVLAPLMGIGVLWGMIWTVGRYLKSTRPR